MTAVARAVALAAILFVAGIAVSKPGAPQSKDTPPPAADAAAPAAKGAPPAAKGHARADTSSCITCHRDADEAYLRKPVAAWATDVHAAAGLGCESCHGGDAKIRLEDPDEWSEASMDAAKGFKSPPGRLEIPAFCGRCHADAAYMKRFNPQARVDQLAEYRTSVHGKLNAKGDATPATCIDCHGIHGIRPVAAPNSPAYAANVPKTCAKCHADAAKMAPYKIPINQYEQWGESVHATALLEAGDTSAPACNDCHGNHGAAPPEVKSVVYVCGHCHAREAGLYRNSMKQALFEKLKVPECIVCHDHHLVRHPTPELFHADTEPKVTAGKITSRDPFAAELGALGPGQRVVATWRDVLKPHIPAEDRRFVHTIEISTDTAKPLILDATVRPGTPTAPVTIHAGSPTGLSAALTITPLSGLPVQPGDALLLRLEVAAGAALPDVRVRDVPGKGVDPLAGSACITCHKSGDSCDVAAENMYAALSTLDRELREAAALLHRAEMAGMEVSIPKFDLKSKGTTAAVEARALIHAFDPARLTKRAAEGRAAATAAKKAGEGALEELQIRRKGLAVSLILIALVLAGLYLKIRDVDRRRRAELRDKTAA